MHLMSTRAALLFAVLAFATPAVHAQSPTVDLDAVARRAIAQQKVVGASVLVARGSEKLKSVAPDIFIRPEVGGFGALDYFKVQEIFRAAEPAKEALKRKLSQRLVLPS